MRHEMLTNYHRKQARQMIAEHQEHCARNREAYLNEAKCAGYDDLEEYENYLNQKSALVLIAIFITLIAFIVIIFYFALTNPI